MRMEARFDRIIIQSPRPPLDTGIKDLKQTDMLSNALKRLLPRLPIVYEKIARGRDFFILYKPLCTKAYVKTNVIALLSIKAGQLSPKDIEKIALEMFGSLQGLMVSSIETRVDFFGVTFKEISAQLAVIGKQKVNRRYQGETHYFGSPKSGHQIVLYDKGLEQKKQSNVHIRVEARNRIEEEQPDLKDFLRGAWRLNKPFRQTFLVDTNTLFARNEKISIQKIGLTTFYFRLNKNQKATFRKKIKDHIRLDFNLFFDKWWSTWVDPTI